MPPSLAASHRARPRGRAAAASLTAGTIALTLLLSGIPYAARPAAGADTAVRYATLSTKAARTVADREIHAAQLRDYLTFIASDELEGRDTPSRGLDIAARYIASHLSRWGAKPAGDDGTFFQKMTLVRRGIDTEKSTASLGGKTLRYGEDFVIVSGRTAVESAPLVFAGHGWVVKSKNIDPYQGVDVKGKLILVTSSAFGTPPGIRRNELPRNGQGSDWMMPEQYAAKNGALGVVRLTTDADAFRQTAGFMTRRNQGFVPVKAGDAAAAAPSGAAEAQPVSVSVAPTVLDALFAGESLTPDAVRASAQSADVKGFALSDAKRLSVSPVVSEEKATTQNVVAIVEGSDPVLKNEYVALGAHYDHVGTTNSPGPDGDRIFNGADDDGSGTVALMAIAEALARNPKERPKRSVLFVWHCGEEHGLWGSEYFTDNPTVPLKNIVTQINLDMIGRSRKEGDTNPRNANLSGPNGIFVIGSKMLSTQLGELTAKTNREYLNVDFDYRYDDPNDPNRFYYRSDHYNYAKKGIPIVFFFDGVHEDYHRQGDEVDKIDFDKMTKVTRTVLLTTVEVANLPSRPVVDGKSN